MFVTSLDGEMQIATLLSELKARRTYKGQIVHVERIPSRRAWYGRLERSLPRQLKAALERSGVKRFYIHQPAASAVLTPFYTPSTTVS